MIVGNEKQDQLTVQSCEGSASATENCIDPDHNPPETVRWDHYTDYSECDDPEECARYCNGNQGVSVAAVHHYKWEC